MPTTKRTTSHDADAPAHDRVGAGGETHQRAGGDSPVMTSAHGVPICLLYTSDAADDIL